MGKCFCHLNGFEVKDANARNNIELAKSDIKKLQDDIKSIADAQFPEGYVEETVATEVTNYVDENSGGFATNEDIEELKFKTAYDIEKVDNNHSSNNRIESVYREDFFYIGTYNGAGELLYTEDKRWVSCKIDADTLTDDTLFVKLIFNNGAIPLHMVKFFDANMTLLTQTATWEPVTEEMKFLSGISAIKKAFPTIKYIMHTYLFTEDGNSANYIPCEKSDYIIDVYKKIPNTEDRLPIVTVDIKGNGDYTSLIEAVNNTSDGDTILILPGVYDGAVHMFGKERHLVGICKDTCIIRSGGGDYANPPLEANIGSVKNLTIIADDYAPVVSAESTESKCYGIHVEHPNTTDYSLVIENCKILSKWNAGIGLGVRHNQNVIIKDCDITTTARQGFSTSSNSWANMGALFFHNDATGNNLGNNGKIRVQNCNIEGKSCALSLYSTNTGNELNAELINNTLYCEDSGVASGVIDRRGQAITDGCLAGEDIKLRITSHGNNIAELNAAN